MIGIDVDTLMQDFKDHVGLQANQTEWDNTKVLRYLNRSFWSDVLNKYPFREAEKTGTLNTIAGTDTYNVPTDLDALQSLSYDDPITLQRTKLKRISKADYESYRSAQVYDRGAPEGYFRFNNQIILLPFPDQVYTLTYTYLASLTDLAVDGSIPIPREWHEVILFGGVMRAFLAIRDFDSANLIKNHQTSLINNMVPVENKEETDSQFAGLNVLRSIPGQYRRRLWR